jgi:anti-anti-sigma factor
VPSTMTLTAPPEPLTIPPTPSVAGLLVALDLPAGRITLTGELDRETCGHLTAACPVLAAAAGSVWVLNLAGLTFCDASGLRALASARRAVTDGGAAVLLVGARPFLRPLLPLVDLDDVLAPPARPVPAPAVYRAGRRRADALARGGRDAAGRA